MRHRVRILTRSEAQSGTFTTSETFTTIVTVWGQLIPLSGLQKIDTKQIGEGVTHRILIRYRAEISDRHWLEIDGRRFDVKSFRVLDERERYLELMVEENETV
jgi:SPP1 family predicted phage head-tail adaptor